VAGAANSVRPTTTLAAMPFPDDPDDDAGFIPPLPPEDRLWRHPSELSGAGVRPNPAPMPAPSRGNSSRPVLIGTIALLIGVAATLAILGATGSLGSSGPGTAATASPSTDAIPPAVDGTLSTAVVRITADRSSGSVSVTGLMLRADGHLVTTADAIGDARSFTVTSSSGMALNATLVGVDTSEDIAVLDIEGTDLPIASAAATTDAAEGDTVFVIGRSTGQVRSWATSGRMTATHVRLDATDGSALYDMIEIGVASAPPTSASVLSTGDGRVLGIFTSREPANLPTVTSSVVPLPFTDPAPTLLWAIPIGEVTRIADDIIDTGAVRRPWLGVVVDDAGSMGIEIRTVATDSPAARVGLRVGDVVTSVDDNRIATTDDLVIALRAHHPGDRVTVGYQRDGAGTTTAVTLSEHP
jgi:putative serine protease PepD